MNIPKPSDVFPKPKPVKPPACAEKKTYTKKEATTVAARMRNASDQPLQAFHCNTHHCWHVGHKPGWKSEHPEASKVARHSLRTPTPKAAVPTRRPRSSTKQLAIVQGFHDGVWDDGALEWWE